MNESEASCLRSDPKLIQLSQFLSLFKNVLKLQHLDKTKYRLQSHMFEDQYTDMLGMNADMQAID